MAGQYWSGPSNGDYRTVDSSGTNYLLGGSIQNPNDYRQFAPDSGAISHNAVQGMNQAAPQMDASQQAQFRAMQMQQAQQLQGIASGQQQGAGELAVQRQVANAQAAQQAQARMARGGGAGMAGIQASRAQAGIGLQGAGQSQQAALQDQQMAQSQLAGTLNSGRSGDLSMAGTNAQLQAGQNQLAQGYNNQLLQQSNAELQGQNSNWQAAQQDKGILGGVMGGIGAAMMSDERSKTEIEDASEDIDDMLSKLAAKTYRYKDEEKYGKGKRAGIMVQDLEKSKAGKAITVDIPGTGMRGFDVAKAVSAALASAARLSARLKKLEGAR